MWKPLLPVIERELVDIFLLKQAVVMPEEEDSAQFLVGKSRSRSIAQALKTRPGASIVSLTDT